MDATRPVHVQRPKIFDSVGTVPMDRLNVGLETIGRSQGGLEDRILYLYYVLLGGKGAMRAGGTILSALERESSSSEQTKPVVLY